jgi:hypothetical protein
MRVLQQWMEMGTPFSMSGNRQAMLFRVGVV